MYKAGQWVTVPVILGPSSGQLHGRAPGNVLFGHAAGHPHRPWPASATPRSTRRPPTPAAFSPNGDGARDTATLQAGAVGRRRLDDRPERRVGRRGGPVLGHGRPASAVVGRQRRRRQAPARRRPTRRASRRRAPTARPGRRASPCASTPWRRCIDGAHASCPAVISPNGDRVADAAPDVRRERDRQRGSHGARRARRRRCAPSRPVAPAAGTARLDLGRQGELGRRPGGGGRRRATASSCAPPTPPATSRRRRAP